MKPAAQDRCNINTLISSPLRQFQRFASQRLSQFHKLFHFLHKLLELFIRNGATFFGYLDVEKLGKDQRELTFWRPGNVLKQQRDDRFLQAMSQRGLPLTSVRLTVFFCYATNKDLWQGWKEENNRFSLENYTRLEKSKMRECIMSYAITLPSRCDT